jgi:tetratricopeptide (TPR) repeat protein
MNLSCKITLRLLAAGVALLSFSCSNTKNTASTRAFHNVTARYNVIFEAEQSYQRGIDNISGNIKPDYTELLPVFKIDAPEAASLASSDMDACIEECGKNILKHSITSKPGRGYSRSGMSESQQSFFNKPEYCKWIDDTYLLMGKANYVNADYDRAESSFQLGTTRFKHEPTRFEAQFWLAKTFWAQKNYDESYELLEKLEKDKRHPQKIDADIHRLFADIAVSGHRYSEAVSEIEKTLTFIKKRKKQERAWLLFISGDLNRLAGNYPKAKECYRQVIKLNPEYPLVFNSKINLATVFTKGENADYIRSQLLLLAKDEKNRDYYDRIYYGLAELDKKNQDFNSALINYRKSARYSSLNNVQKAKSYMGAADIYFDRNDYVKAGEFYDSTMQFLPRTYSGYVEISKKAADLTELISYIGQAEYQDSIQRVAKLPLSERQKIIAKIIDDVIAKEEAEKIAATNPYYQSSDNNYGVEYTGQDGNPNFQGKWYMYNVTALNYGRQEFLKKWGTRPLEDNWRRKNKGITEETASQSEDGEGESNEGVPDVKNPEYYASRLPLTDSAMKVSVNKETEAWFRAADVYSEKIGDLDKAVETLLKLNEKHHDYYLKAQVYYTLHDLYLRKGETGLAEYTKTQLVSEFPESGYAKILNDPSYIKNVNSRKERAVAFYEEMLGRFNAGDYAAALEMCEKGAKEYAGLQIEENFVYMQARCYGRLQDTEKMRQQLHLFMENYPGSTLFKYAENKLSALEGGNNGEGRFDKDFASKPHCFVIAADKEGKGVKELNFKILNFCASNGYAQADVNEKNFSDKYKLYIVPDFPKKDAAREFLKKFVSENTGLEDHKVFVISVENFELLKETSDIEEYYNFYLNHYTD